uniref:Tyrosinase copper-binding domain-containing protein n=1 Tax=Globisporangium ultimum (strain ATCC 200006 / CBS 805.95 / DAOM BR144) TaxID=431595 RepID=K3X1K4_GLOUD
MKTYGLLFWAALIAFLSPSSPSFTSARITVTACGPRLRKSWAAMTSAETTKYKGAIAAAMDSGAYIKFVEMHTEMMSEMEAHRQCMFIYWHRLLLVVFENMLRGQGSQYACVTVPYWDWVSDYNRFVSGQCSNMLDCSYALRALGGSSGTSERYLPINGQDTWGVYIAKSPLDHFCQNSGVTGTRCAKKLTRGVWKYTTLPGSTSYASVVNQLFSSANIAGMSEAIEEGAHNNIHANLAGAMETFASPADPVFWSHHAMVDLLHTIFHKCKVGTNKMTLAEKVNSTIGWTSCERRNGGEFNPYDKVTMRTGLNGVNPKAGAADKVIGKYFSGVPTQFAALMDHNDLGSSSYAYVYQELLSDLYANCGAVVTSDSVIENTSASQRRRLDDTLTAAIDATSHALNTSALTLDSTSNVTTVSSGELVLVTLNATGSSQNAISIATNATSSGSAILLVAAVNTTLEVSSEAVSTFTVSTNNLLVAEVGTDAGSIISEQEKMSCMFQDECLGGVKDYPATFKKNFNITQPPRCKVIVDAIRCGHDTIALANWKETMMASFGCPLPTKS